jgi:hypothetical protein
MDVSVRKHSILTSICVIVAKWGPLPVSAAPNDPNPAPTKQPVQGGESNASIYYYSIIVIVVVPIIIVAALFARRRILNVGRSQYYRQSPASYLAGVVPQTNSNDGNVIMGQDGRPYYNDGRGLFFTADGSRRMVIDSDGTQFFADRIPIAEASAPALQTAQNTAVPLPTAIAYPIKAPNSNPTTNPSLDSSLNSNIVANQPVRYGQYRNSSGQLLAGGAAETLAGGPTAEDCK